MEFGYPTQRMVLRREPESRGEPNMTRNQEQIRENPLSRDFTLLICAGVCFGLAVAGLGTGLGYLVPAAVAFLFYRSSQT